MNLKMKLTTTIAAFFLVLGLLMMGVYSAQNATVNLGGSILFTATNVHAKVSGTVSNAVTNPTLPTLEFKAETQTDTSDWEDNLLEFNDDGSAITISISIENLSTRSLYAKVADAIGSTEYLTKTIKKDGSDYNERLFKVDALSTEQVVITLEVADKNVSLPSGIRYGYTIVMQDESIVDNTAQDVEATVNGASHIAGTVTNFAEQSITKGSNITKITQPISRTITTANAAETASYIFTVKNDSTSQDLYVEPECALASDDSVITAMYYSTDGTNYSAFVDACVAHSNSTVYVKVDVKPATAVTNDIAVEGDIVLNLYPEGDKPAGYVQEYTYSIIDNEAYKTPICPTHEDCSQSAIKMAPSEYIIATPDTAQDILNSNINGKVVIFDKGTDGTTKYTNVLNILPTTQTTTAVYKGWESTTAPGEVADINSLVGSQIYHYERNLNNVVFAGTEGVTFENLFQAYSGAIGYNTTGLLYNTMVDPIKGSSIAGKTVAYYSRINLNNVTFTGMNFTGTNGRIYIHNLSAHSEERMNYEININHCSFITDTASSASAGRAAISLTSITGTDRSNSALRNVVVKDNVVQGHYQGIYLGNAVGAQVTGNTISKTTHNGIAIQTSDSGAAEVYRFYGDIIVANNTVSNTSDRAIRFGVGKDANIVIQNNAFTSAVDTDKGFIKSQSLTNTTFTFVNNTYGGTALADEKSKPTKIVMTIA